VIGVRLASKDIAFDTIALVDSGSDRTLIQKEEADLLGLTAEKDTKGNLLNPEVIGAGGNFRCTIRRLPTMLLMKNVTPFATFTGTRAWVPEREGIIPYDILGRDTVFSHFAVTFHERRQKMTFRRL